VRIGAAKRSADVEREEQQENHSADQVDQRHPPAFARLMRPSKPNGKFQSIARPSGRATMARRPEVWSRQAGSRFDFNPAAIR
jgi:hypothetical protein